MLQITSTAIRYLQTVALPKTVFIKTPAVSRRSQAAPETTAISSPVATKLSEANLFNALTKEQEDQFFYRYEYRTRIGNSQPLKPCLDGIMPAALEIADIRNQKNSGISEKCFEDIENTIKDRLIRAFGFHICSSEDAKVCIKSLFKVQHLKKFFTNKKLPIPKYIIEIEQILKNAALQEISEHQGIMSPSIYKPIFELQLALFSIQRTNNKLRFSSSLTAPLFDRK